MRLSPAIEAPRPVEIVSNETISGRRSAVTRRDSLEWDYLRPPKRGDPPRSSRMRLSPAFKAPRTAEIVSNETISCRRSAVTRWDSLEWDYLPPSRHRALLRSSRMRLSPAAEAQWPAEIVSNETISCRRIAVTRRDSLEWDYLLPPEYRDPPR